MQQRLTFAHSLQSLEGFAHFAYQTREYLRSLQSMWREAISFVMFDVRKKISSKEQEIRS